MKADRILQAGIVADARVHSVGVALSLAARKRRQGRRHGARISASRPTTARPITARDFGGKLLMLNFWATWCPPCVEEIPVAQRDWPAQLGPKGLVVLGVSVDKDREAYQQFPRRASTLAFLTARDPDARDQARSYGTIQYPESYLIDRNGKVVEKIVSSQPTGRPPQMIEHVQSLL